MANFTALKTAINNAIKTNGNEEITGAILQAILDAMVETLGDSAITDLENAITTEVTNRENAVGDVAADLAAEALARANKDNQLDGRINQEEYNRQNADAALSQTMSQGFQTLGSQMTALNAAISALNAAYQNGYLYGGIATPSSSPSNNKCFYIALQGGTYTNFGGVGIVEGINIIKNDSGWKVEHIYDQTTLLNEFYLLRQQVIRALASYEPIIVYGDVTNAPDEEDLTSNAQHLLKFKDRDYSPLNFSGLGMKILRKNILPLNDSVAFNGFLEGVTAEEILAGSPELIFWDRMNTRFVGIKDGIYYAAWTDDDNYVPASTSLVYMYDGTPYKWDGSNFSVDEDEAPNLQNCLTQDMINDANTIYIIRYDFTLKEDITIPANCVLQFDGGSISGEHTIIGNNTGVQAILVKIFETTVTFDGSFNIPILYPIWFGVDETEISYLPWYALRDAISVLKPKEVRFDGEYHPNGVGFTNISDCILNFSESKVYGQTNNVDGSGTVIGFTNCSNVTIKGGTFIARYFGGAHNGSVWNNCISISGKNVIVDGVTCYQENQDIGGRGIDLQGELLEDITIVNCTCYNGENGIDILPINGYIAKNIIISNCNLIGNYEGILINVGGYGKYAQNIVISDINIESPIFRGLDIRGVHQLSVSNVNIKGCKSTGIYTNLVDGTIKGVNVIADDTVSTLHTFAPTGIYINETVPSMFDDYDGLKPLILTDFYISGVFNNAINLIRGGMIIANGYAEGWDSSNYGIADSVNGNMYQNIAYKSEHELITVRLDTLYSNIYKQVSDNKVFPQRNNPVIPYGGFIDYPTYLTNPDQTAPNYRLIHESGYFKLKNTKTNNDLVKVEKTGKVWIGNMSLEGNNIQLIGLDGSTRYRIYVDNNGELQCVTA